MVLFGIRRACKRSGKIRGCCCFFFYFLVALKVVVWLVVTCDSITRYVEKIYSRVYIGDGKVAGG